MPGAARARSAPRGVTAVASAMTRPAPPVANEPRWTKVPVVGDPLRREEYGAHRRNADAVAERDGSQGKRLEQAGHGWPKGTQVSEVRKKGVLTVHVDALAR